MKCAPCMRIEKWPGGGDSAKLIHIVRLFKHEVTTVARIHICICTANYNNIGGIVLFAHSLNRTVAVLAIS